MKKMITALLLLASIQSFGSQQTQSSEPTFDICFATMSKSSIERYNYFFNLYYQVGAYYADITGVNFQQTEEGVRQMHTVFFSIKDRSKSLVRSELADALQAVQESGLCRQVERKVRSSR